MVVIHPQVKFLPPPITLRGCLPRLSISGCAHGHEAGSATNKQTFTYTTLQTMLLYTIELDHCLVIVTLNLALLQAGLLRSRVRVRVRLVGCTWRQSAEPLRTKWLRSACWCSSAPCTRSLSWTRSSANWPRRVAMKRSPHSVAAAKELEV